jgi:hypothetical protein
VLARIAIQPAATNSSELSGNDAAKPGRHQALAHSSEFATRRTPLAPKVELKPDTKHQKDDTDLESWSASSLFATKRACVWAYVIGKRWPTIGDNPRRCEP